MIEWIVFGALVAFTFFGPFIKRGGNAAKHNALLVKLPTDATSIAQGNHPDGRRVQEVGENRFQGLVALVPALVATLTLEAPYAPLVAVLAYIVVKSLLYAVPAIDDAGHGAEIMVAEADGHSSYYIGEITRMLNDPKRAGKTFGDVLADLEGVRWLSRFMVVLAR